MPKNQRVTFMKLIRRSTTSTVAQTPMSQGESRNSQPGRPMVVLLATPITFDCRDHLDFVPKLGRYPVIIKYVKLNRVPIRMGLFRTALRPSQAPFHGIVPRAAATPVSQISLPLTFRTQENFCTKNLQFEVANFKTAYNVFLGRSALTKFMTIPHYAYSAPHGVISIRGGIKRAYDCDKESCETADRFMTFAELQE
jgi:hypothetical protein